jgi:murein tripeptide amidase MpaA
MAIDDDIGAILNEINITVVDETLQDQNNSTNFPNVPTILIPEVITEVTTNKAALVVDQGVKNRGRGRPQTSALKAKVDDIKDPILRRRKFNDASSARHRRNKKRKDEEMEQALVDETERNAKLTVEVELLEKQVEDFKAKILDMIKKPRVVQVVSEPVVKPTPEADDSEAFPDIWDLL